MFALQQEKTNGFAWTRFLFLVTQKSMKTVFTKYNCKVSTFQMRRASCS